MASSAKYYSKRGKYQDAFDRFYKIRGSMIDSIPRDNPRRWEILDEMASNGQTLVEAVAFTYKRFYNDGDTYVDDYATKLMRRVRLPPSASARLRQFKEDPESFEINDYSLDKLMDEALEIAVAEELADPNRRIVIDAVRFSGPLLRSINFRRPAAVGPGAAAGSAAGSASRAEVGPSAAAVVEIRGTKRRRSIDEAAAAAGAGASAPAEEGMTDETKKAMLAVLIENKLRNALRAMRIAPPPASMSLQDMFYAVRVAMIRRGWAVPPPSPPPPVVQPAPAVNIQDMIDTLRSFMIGRGWDVPPPGSLSPQDMVRALESEMIRRLSADI